MHPQITPTLFFQFLGKEVSSTASCATCVTANAIQLSHPAVSCKHESLAHLSTCLMRRLQHAEQVEGSGTPGESLLGHSSQDSVGMDMWSFCTVSTFASYCQKVYMVARATHFVLYVNRVCTQRRAAVG
jgi:hypothetical protein